MNIHRQLLSVLHRVYKQQMIVGDYRGIHKFVYNIIHKYNDNLGTSTSNLLNTRSYPDRRLTVLIQVHNYFLQVNNAIQHWDGSPLIHIKSFLIIISPHLILHQLFS